MEDLESGVAAQVRQVACMEVDLAMEAERSCRPAEAVVAEAVSAEE